MAVRRIFCLDMDCFFVSVERVLNPALKGKPVIVGAKPDERGVVSACSYETRKFGVHSGMASSRAGRLCPHAIFLRGNGKHYTLFSREARAILESYVPVVQAASIDEFYLDMTGTERLYGPMLTSAKRIKRMIYRGIKLPCTIGIGSSKMIAKIACNLAKPDGILEVAPGNEEFFLRDLPVGEMPGIGKVMQEKLHEWGICSLGEIAEIPLPILKSAFGKHGEIMRARARGIGSGNVNPIGGPPKSIGHESTFSTDSENPAMIESVLFRLAEKIGRRLRKKKLIARTITLKFRLSNFKTITRSHTLDQPTDHDAAIFAIAQTLFRKAYGSRSRVRLVGIRATKLSINAGQLSLFDMEDELKKHNFYSGLDRIRNRYGFGAIVSGRNFKNIKTSA